jgi:hypothetical protein
MRDVPDGLYANVVIACDLVASGNHAVPLETIGFEAIDRRSWGNEDFHAVMSFLVDRRSLAG